MNQKYNLVCDLNLFFNFADQGPKIKRPYVSLSFGLCVTMKLHLC